MDLGVGLCGRGKRGNRTPKITARPPPGRFVIFLPYDPDSHRVSRCEATGTILTRDFYLVCGCTVDGLLTLWSVRSVVTCHVMFARLAFSTSRMCTHSHNPQWIMKVRPQEVQFVWPTLIKFAL